MFRGKKILVCGGTGSIGSEIVAQLLRQRASQVRVFARTEEKHEKLLEKLNYPRNVRSLVGDVRDITRITTAMDGVDIVFNAAAMKAVQYCEYNPFEAVMTNVMGTQNIIEAAFTHNVEKVITISTDKAAEPMSTLGATKLLSERLTVAADSFRGRKRTTFTAVRFGNVLGSNNSLLPRIRERILKSKPVLLTDENMSRFIMSIPDAVKLVFLAVKLSRGGEVFILKMPSVKIKDLITTYVELVGQKNNINISKIKIKKVGIRSGEKLHEKLLSSEELTSSLQNDKLYVILSHINKPNEIISLKRYKGFTGIKNESAYNSQTAAKLTRPEIKDMIKRAEIEI